MNASVRVKQLPLGLLTGIVIAGCGGPPSPGTIGNSPDPAAVAAAGAPTDELVLQGRQLVINRDCGACHGGMPNPAADGWLAGRSGDDEAEVLGPFRVWARNITPHDETGLGRVSERQIFNALRYGLRPSATPDVEITSMIPGQGNHPSNPNYLSPAMPWVNWRFMSDDELRGIAAYLKRGVRPVDHRIPESEAPPDFWASEYTVEKIGTHILPPFPTQHEELRDPQRREQVLRGRGLVASAACAGCHGGAVQPNQDGWLTGARPGLHPTDVFQIGPFKTYPRNLTPDNVTGLGRFSERQIFNSLRYGLRPGETADVVITSTTQGVGNHPASPKYMAVPMPWPAWRHMSDDELWAIAAYLKNGVRPVRNLVADSEGPPDFWASEYTPDKIGTFPAAPFPTAKERAVVAGTRR